MSKSKIITLQKTVYLSGQNRDEGACVQPNSNLLGKVHHEIMSDQKMTRHYKFDLQKWEYFPTYENKEAKTDFYDFSGWNGLRKIFPFVDRDSNVECLVTVIFDSKDTCGYDDECQIDEYEKMEELYNFHAESDYYAVSKDNGDIMLCRGDNSLFWEIDDGYIKWDCNREEGGLIWGDSPLKELFPESETDYHSVGKPYKLKIIVDAII